MKLRLAKASQLSWSWGLAWLSLAIFCLFACVCLRVCMCVCMHVVCVWGGEVSRSQHHRGGGNPRGTSANTRVCQEQDFNQDLKAKSL